MGIALESPIEYRQVTISVPFGPFGSSSITSRTADINADDGVIIVFEAPMGLYGRNRYRVVDAEDGKGLVLREEAKLTGLSILMPFVLSTEKESHAKHRQSVADELERRASSGGK